MGPLVFLWAALVAQEPVADALTAVRDSLSRVRGASAGFQGDLAAASGILLYQRTLRMRASCNGAAAAVASLDSVLASTVAGAATQERQARLRDEVAELRRALAQCSRDYDTTRWAARADSIRAWGPYRLRRLDEALGRYTRAAAAFKKSAGLR